MFENKTFENILDDMLNYAVYADPEVDVNVGSVIYNALAPIALELETAYKEMNGVMEETFMSTASKDYLVEHGKQLGVPINEATHAHFQCETDVELEIGTRFNNDKFNYTVTQYLSTNSGDDTSTSKSYVYIVMCETAGSEPNGYLGDLTQITYVPNLTYAKLTSVVTYGEDEEDTEAYRYRLQVHCNNAPIDGNVTQYNEWLDEYDGIGKYKVTPLWNGANTVKLTILSPENTAASTELINQVQQHFDPVDSPGMGMGKAPIGAVVTVDTVKEVEVTVEAYIVLKEGFIDCTTAVNSVEEYINSLVLTTNKIAYMPIAAALYNAEGVADLAELYVKVKDVTLSKDTLSVADSVTLDENEIPILNPMFTEA